MRKRECIYLHALCMLLCEELRERPELPAEDLPDDDDASRVAPTEVHRSKGDHRAAMFERLDAAHEAVAATDRDSDSVHVDFDA